MQLHHDIAALDQIQLLSPDIPVVIGHVLFPEPGLQEAFPVIEDAEAQVVSRQTQAHQQHNEAAHQQHGPVGNSSAEGHNPQSGEDYAEDAVALVSPDGQTGAMLGLAAERPGKPLVHQVADAEHRRGHQYDCDKFHFLSPWKGESDTGSFA